MIAHDFRNVLQVAISAVNMTRRRLLRSDTELAGTLSDALDALDRAALLAQRLSTPGAEAAEPEQVRIQSLVLGLRGLLTRAVGPGIRLETLVSDDLAPVICDQQQLEDALLNLAVNAKDSMPDGGVVVIEALRCSQADHGAECIALTVSDTGMGMPKEVAEQAFDAFFTTKASNGGSGLGLHNVQTFVKRLGGSVELSTGEKIGTRIRLHLPGLAAQVCESTG